MRRLIVQANDRWDDDISQDEADLNSFLRGLMRYRGAWVTGPVISADLDFTYSQWKAARRAANARSLSEQRSRTYIDPFTENQKLIFDYRITARGMAHVVASHKMGSAE